MVANRFLPPEELEQFFHSQSRAKPHHFKHGTQLKIYVGAEFLVYSWDKHNKLTLHTAYMVSDISLSAEKLWVTFLDKQSYKMVKIGNIPVKLGGHELLLAVPTHTTIEKTVKTTKSNNFLIEGLTTTMNCYMMNHPKWKTSNNKYIIPQHQAENYFGTEVFKEAVEVANQ